jgi:probable H4MPT-linked C1 transfer pathway protein
MWREQGRLEEAVRRILGMRPDCQRVVATMTGEIADCFVSRQDGVRVIVEALAAACGPGTLSVYLVDGSFVSPLEAIARFREAAASNWHAMATHAAKLAAPARGLLVDVGSTTIDIVQFDGGSARPIGCDDFSRLASGELVYTGVERTPVAAIVHELPWRGRLHAVARERFADAQDAWLLLGLPLQSGSETADGRPLDAAAAAARLARMLLLDAEDFTAADAAAAAEFIAVAQTRLVADAMRRVADQGGGRPEVVVLSGHGSMLASRCLSSLGWSGCRVISIEEESGEAASRVGPAHALARMALGRLP